MPATIAAPVTTVTIAWPTTRTSPATASAPNPSVLVSVKATEGSEGIRTRGGVDSIGILSG